MTQIRVCLIRHGETDWNRAGRLQGIEDIPLNSTGENQAVLVGDYLRTNGTWDTIVSSPLKRAKRTAELVAERLGFKTVVFEDLLRERDYGESSGLTREERKTRFPDGNEPGWEPIEHVRMRSMQVLNKLSQGENGRNIIVVSHGAVINSMLALLSNGEIGTGKTALENACISYLLCNDKGKWEIESYNKVVWRSKIEL